MTYGYDSNGDEATIGGRSIGTLARFHMTHMLNHMNLHVKSASLEEPPIRGRRGEISAEDLAKAYSAGLKPYPFSGAPMPKTPLESPIRPHSP